MNADVLEVIAEYACATVTGACALRGSCKGYRRAVDTTVRRLVYEDQPQLLQDCATGMYPETGTSATLASLKIHRAETGRDAAVDRDDPAADCSRQQQPATLRQPLPPIRDGSQPATLHVHFYTEHLDAVRIALTCDVFPRIARLVVVAFALDGAKDEAHEGAACGPRPVSSGDHISASRRVAFLQTCDAVSGWANPLQLRAAQHNPSLRAEAALLRCLSEVTVFENDLTDDLCTAVESASRPWAGVRKFVLPSDTGSPRHGVRILRAIGPQLTHLVVSFFDHAWCPILATCGNLVEVQIDDADLSPEATAEICDALIASGAKLERFSFPHADPAHAGRVLEAVRTIVAVGVLGLTVDVLLPAVTDRLQLFNRTASHERLPCLRYVVQASDTWSPSEFATAVVGRTPLPVADLATAFPRLRELHIPGIAPDVGPADIALPQSLEEVIVSFNRRSDPTAIAVTTAAVVSGLAWHGPAHLCNLVDVALPLFANRCRDLAPLSCFASTLRRLTLLQSNEGAWSPDDIASIEATLSQLVSLERVEVKALPTARCFCGGKHMRLRKLKLGGLRVPFDVLVKACPRLVYIRLESVPTDAGSSIADGWVSSRFMSEFTIQRRSVLDPL